MESPVNSSRKLRLVPLCFALPLLLAGCPDRIPEPIADLADLDAGWNRIAPGGETTCSDGSPYHFFARPGDPSRLMVYFQGGGACWDGATCDPDLKPTYYVNVADSDPAQANGILAFDNADNPFADYSVVFAPYCTGDVHLGDRVATYTAPETDEHAAHAVTINHEGTVNAAAVLDWLQARFFRPSTIFVTGSSAGSIPSPYYAMLIAEQYPESRVAQLGDGSSGYRRAADTAPVEDSWGTLEVLSYLPEFKAMGPGELTYESLYVAAATRHRDVQFAAFDFAEDATQKRFLSISGSAPESLLPLIVANQEDIRSQVDNFHSFIAGGDVHTILLRPEFYAEQVNGTRVRDWVASLADGRPVEDVICTDCAAVAGGETSVSSQ